MPDAISAFTGSVPENYERYLGPYLFEPYAKELLTRISSIAVNSLLETACGTGRVTGQLRKAFPPDVRLVATDLNPDMIAIAKKSMPDGNIVWLTADAQDLPFDNNSFDLLVCQFGLMFVPDKAKALSEAFRVLKPGGRIVVDTWDKLEENPAFYTADQIVKRHFPVDPPLFFHIPFSMHDEKELQSLFAKAGFRDIRIDLVQKKGSSPSAADTATGILLGSPIYPAIMGRDPDHLPQIKKELETELSRQFGDTPMISPLQAWIVMAEKSTVF